MTDVGELKVRITADAGKLDSELKRAQGLVQQSAGVMSSAFGGLKAQLMALAPAISAVAFVSFAKQAIDAAGHITDLADRIGFAADTIAAMEVPLAASGTSLDEFASSVARMNNAIGEARNGNEAAIRAFDALGLSVDKLAQMSPEEQFYAIAGALGQIKDQSIQTEAGMNIFGRSFSAMLPLLKEYEGDMRKAVDAQKELNEGLSEDTLRRIDQFGDSLTTAGIRIKNAFLEALGAILRVTDAIGGDGLPPNASFERPKTVDVATRNPAAINDALRRRGLPPVSAEGSNQELLDRIKAQKDAAKATSEHTTATKELKEKNDELARAMQEAAQIQALFHDRLTRGLTDIVFRADSASDAINGIAEAIARMVFERKVAGPLVDSLIGSGGNPGLLDGVFSSIGGAFGGFFADGGRPPMGIPSVVGERGPEIFVPDTAGTVIPNHKIGGQTVIVQQTIQVNPGVPELINAKIREAAPVIEARAQAGVFAALEKGGSESQLARLRS